MGLKGTLRPLHDPTLFYPREERYLPLLDKLFLTGFMATHSQACRSRHKWKRRSRRGIANINETIRVLALRLNAFEDFRLYLRENVSSCGSYSNLNSNLILPNEWHNNSWQVFFPFLKTQLSHIWRRLAPYRLHWGAPVTKKINRSKVQVS